MITPNPHYYQKDIKYFFKKGGNLDVQMSVTVEEQKKGDEKNEVKRIIRIMVRKVYETHNQDQNI